MSINKIAIKISDTGDEHDAVVQIHIIGGHFGDYTTFCGIDADDPTVGHFGVVPLPPNAKIDCQACYSDWKAVKDMKLKLSDFDDSVKRRMGNFSGH